MFRNRVRISFGGRRGGPISCIVSAVFGVLILGCMLAILLVVFNMLRSSDVVTAAVARAEADSRAVAALGTPLEVGWLITGSMNTDAAGGGSASLSVPVSGPQGKGTLHLLANKSGGKWQFSSLTLTIAANDETLDLLER